MSMMKIKVEIEVPSNHQCLQCQYLDYGIMHDGKDFCNVFLKKLNCIGTETLDKGKRVASHLLHFKCQECLDICDKVRNA